MEQIVLHLKDEPIEVVVQRARDVYGALTDNPNVPEPHPSLPEMLALITDVEDAVDKYEFMKTQLRALKDARDKAVKRLKAGMRIQSKNVMTATEGNAAQIASTGFQIKASGSSVGVPAQPRNLRLKAMDGEGTIKATWKPVYGAHTYYFEVCFADSPSEASWPNKGSSTNTRLTLNNLASGTRIWLRVRAVGAAGPGPWSDPATKIVP